MEVMEETPAFDDDSVPWFELLAGRDDIGDAFTLLRAVAEGTNVCDLAEVLGMTRAACAICSFRKFQILTTGVADEDEDLECEAKVPLDVLPGDEGVAEATVYAKLGRGSAAAAALDEPGSG